MSFQIEKLIKLKEAYSTGVLLVRFGDQEIRYQSSSEMKKVIDNMEKELFGTKPVRTIKPRFSKDLD